MKNKKKEIKGIEKIKYEVTQEIGISTSDKPDDKKKTKSLENTSRHIRLIPGKNKTTPDEGGEING